jgi:hypothetical protein
MHVAAGSKRRRESHGKHIMVASFLAPSDGDRAGAHCDIFQRYLSRDASTIHHAQLQVAGALSALLFSLSNSKNTTNKDTLDQEYRFLPY